MFQCVWQERIWGLILVVLDTGISKHSEVKDENDWKQNSFEEKKINAKPNNQSSAFSINRKSQNWLPR